MVLVSMRCMKISGRPFLAVLILAGLVGCDDEGSPAVSKPSKAGSRVRPVASVGLPDSGRKPAAPATSAAADPETQARELNQLRLTVTSLQQENLTLRQQLARQGITPVTAKLAPKPTPYLPNKSGISAAGQLPPATLRPRPDGFPTSGSSLNHQQFGELMTGAVEFNPGPIVSSDRPVTDSTPLRIGQEVQLKWGSTWWAATITGFEPDGTVRTSYFGWNRNHDEAVPRSDLQLDTNTREKAIQNTYSYQP